MENSYDINVSLIHNKLRKELSKGFSKEVSPWEIQYDLDEQYRREVLNCGSSVEFTSLCLEEIQRKNKFSSNDSNKYAKKSSTKQSKKHFGKNKSKSENTMVNLSTDESSKKPLSLEKPKRLPKVNTSKSEGPSLLSLPLNSLYYRPIISKSNKAVKGLLADLSFDSKKKSLEKKREHFDVKKKNISFELFLKEDEPSENKPIHEFNPLTLFKGESGNKLEREVKKVGLPGIFNKAYLYGKIRESQQLKRAFEKNISKKSFIDCLPSITKVEEKPSNHVRALKKVL
jgi:hypothetical protein